MNNSVIKKIFSGDFKEGLLTYSLTILLFSLAKITPSIRAYLIVFLLIYIPILSAKFHSIDYVYRYGLKTENLKKSLTYLLLWIILIFPIYFLILLGSKLPYIEFPKDILYHLLYNIIVIGFSEEFFYRGYLHKLFEKKSKPLFKKIGLDTNVLIVSLLFSLGHFLTYFSVMSILTFFPSLVFGILRNKTGSILASAIFHGISNSALYLILFNDGFSNIL